MVPGVHEGLRGERLSDPGRGPGPPLPGRQRAGHRAPPPPGAREPDLGRAEGGVAQPSSILRPV